MDKVDRCVALRSDETSSYGGPFGEPGSSVATGPMTPATPAGFYTEVWAPEQRNERKRKRSSGQNTGHVLARNVSVGLESGRDGASLQGGASAAVSTPPSLPEPLPNRVDSEPAGLDLAVLVVDHIRGLFETQQMEFEQGDGLPLILTPPQLARMQQQHDSMRSALTFLHSLAGEGGETEGKGVQEGKGLQCSPKAFSQAASFTKRATDMTGGACPGEVELTSTSPDENLRKRAAELDCFARLKGADLARPVEIASSGDNRGESSGMVLESSPCFSDVSKVPWADPPGGVSQSAQSCETGASLEVHRWWGSDLVSSQKEGPDWSVFALELPRDELWDMLADE